MQWKVNIPKNGFLSFGERWAVTLYSPGVCGYFIMLCISHSSQTSINISTLTQVNFLKKHISSGERKKKMQA